jgi:hypothetical protein
MKAKRVRRLTGLIFALIFLISIALNSENVEHKIMVVDKYSNDNWNHLLVCPENITCLNTSKWQVKIVNDEIQEVQFITESSTADITLTSGKQVSQEFREVCFSHFNTTTTLRLTVNTTDALTSINLAVTKITDRNLCNCTQVQCPRASTIWTTVLDGDISDLYANILLLDEIDKANVQCIKPYLRNSYTLDYSNFPLWSISVIVGGIGVIALVVWYICERKWPGCCKRNCPHIGE